MRVDLAREETVKAFVGTHVFTYDQCFRCGACSGICPVKKVTGVFDPRKIVHLLLLGFLDKIPKEVLWYCSQCGSCVPVCPMDVKPKEVIYALREYMLREGLVDYDTLFEWGAFAKVDPKKCIVCLTCVRTCPFKAISIREAQFAYIDPRSCRACGICVVECPARAIELNSIPESLEVRA